MLSVLRARVLTRLAPLLVVVVSPICRAAEKGATDSLVARADAIVAGELQSGRQNGTSAVFVLSVSRSIKGAVQSGAQITVRWDQAWPSRNVDFTGFYGLWFLKSAQATWVLLPIDQGSSKVPLERAYFVLPPTNIPLASSTQPSGPVDGVASELAGAILRYDGVSKLLHLEGGLLQIGDTPVTLDIYRKLSGSSDPEIRIIGLTGLVRAKDPSALATLAANANGLSSLKLSRLGLNAIRALRDGSPGTIHALETFASASSPAVQKSAAEALSMIHTREALPSLALLLDSSDPDARYAGMRGLSMFVDDLPIVTAASIPPQSWRIPQGPAPYRTVDTSRYSLSERGLDPGQEAAYLQFWKTWWAQIGSKVP